MNFRLLWLAFCVVSVPLATAGLVYSEAWDSGKVDPAFWQVIQGEGSKAELVEVSQGDYALKLSGGSPRQAARVYGLKGYARDSGMTCEFSLWTADSGAPAEFYGPWHHTAFVEGLGTPDNSTLDAAIYVKRAAEGESVRWAEGGDVTMGYSGPLLATSFTTALQRATSKAQALRVRIEEGELTGATGEFSTDGGKTWTPLTTQRGKPIDTRGMGAVELWEGVKIGSYRFNLPGFVASGGPVFIDDIVITSKAAEPKIGPTATPIPEARELISKDHLRPAGEWVEREVPDTLDLADRARLLVHGITSFVNPKQGYCTYGQGYFNVNPPYMTQINGSEGHCCWSKNVEALAKARVMSGSEEALDVQEAMMDNLLSDANVLNPTAHDPWIPRSMLAMAFLYQLNPDPRIKDLLDKWTDFQAAMVYEKDGMAYYDATQGNLEATMLGLLGPWRIVFIQGTMVRALSNWNAISGNGPALTLADKLQKFVRQPQYWQAEAAPRVVVSEERGQFMGHHHSYTAALLGLLWYADQTHDRRLMEFVRAGYEYMRNFGLARIGMFAEMCTTGDMTQLALKLSDLDVGDYWDDADSYIRNQLVANQVTDTKVLQAAVDQMPKNERVLDPFYETSDNVVERNLGLYLSDASNPTLVREKTMVWTICCNGNCTPALYYAWDACVRNEAGHVQVNLLLNRMTPWLDVDSYLPYEGKVVLHNKQAKSVSVRLPGWVDHAQVHALDRAGAEVAHRWLDRTLVIDTLAPEAMITVTFPMVTTTETYTLKWKESDFWYESTNPGGDWKPDPQPAKFTMTMKGNTLVDIAPRSQAKGYPLYQRNEMRDGRVAPLHTVRRYVASSWPRQF